MSAPQAGGQEQLEGLEVPEQPHGSLEAAVRKAVAAAALDERDHGAAELAAMSARFVDLASRRRDPFAGAATVRECSSALQRLRLDPASRAGNDAGEVAAWLERLATPTTSEVDDGRRGGRPAG